MVFSLLSQVDLGVARSAFDKLGESSARVVLRSVLGGVIGLLLGGIAWGIEIAFVSAIVVGLFMSTSGIFTGKPGYQLAVIWLGAFVGAIISSFFYTDVGWLFGGIIAGIVFAVFGPSHGRICRMIIAGIVGWTLGCVEEYGFYSVILPSLFGA